MTQKTWDNVYTDAHIITLDRDAGDWGVIRNGAVGVSNGVVAWVGEARDLPRVAVTDVISCQNGWLTPGLIDCHTHLIYGGNRISEFERRLNGESYASISASGGGIISTVMATRAASEEELYQSAQKRLMYLMADGVTCLEIKSGYGLDPETEIKMLRVARRLADENPIDIRTTFLGAHSLPPEYKTDRAAYIDLLINEMLPRIAAENLADAVDCFAETIAFTASETEQIFAAAQKYGLAVKLHADQLSDGNGAALAARFRALSADHLEWTSEQGVAAMAETGTVAVLLPGAFYALRETKLPPIDAMRKHRVPMAIATDCNPGSSPVLSLRLMMSMASTLFGLTPLEALRGVTINAAKALGLDDRGVIAPGQRADFALWAISEPAELSYTIGGQLCRGRVRAGRFYPN